MKGGFCPTDDKKLHCDVFKNGAGKQGVREETGAELSSL